MRSGPAFLDLTEAARWITAQLAKEGVAVGDDLVLRILNRETAFLTMVGLARPADENGAESGYVRREACWILKASAESEGDHDIDSKGGEQDEQHEPT